MAQEKLVLPDWGKLDWQETPYPGVFLFKLEEKIDPASPNVPLFSVFALKVEPGSSIPLHIHKRGPEWRETLVFGDTGDFEILRIGGSERASASSTLTIKPYEVFGIKNLGSRPLFFTSRMEPGFTGYEEIE